MLRSVGSLLSVLVVLAGCGSSGVELAYDGTNFELSGVDTQGTGPGGWQERFSVRVADQDIPMFGDYEVLADRVVFTPRFPLAPGLQYRATYGDSSLEVTIPEPAPGATTVITAVYPESDTLPENLLRFYLQFSAPMRQGRAYDHVRLLDNEGEEVELAFLEIAEELWNPEGTRLTLLFDPGRVKHGLMPRNIAGPALVAGRRYTLEVDGSWQDASGTALGEGRRKNFTVLDADVIQPDPSAWQLEVPGSGGRDPLVLRFPELVDHAQAERMIRVEGVSGSVEVVDGDRRWTLVPDRVWSAGEHVLLVDRDLEDPVGNSIRALFEVDVFDPERGDTPQLVRIPFTVK